MSGQDDIDILGKVRIEDSGSDVLEKVGGLTDRLKDSFGGLADIVKNALGFALGNILTGALEGVFGSVGELVSGALDAQKIVAQLNAVIESTGGVAGMTVDSVLALSDSLAQTTLFTDDAITEAQNLLLTFTNIGSEVFPAATETLLDMAAAMGTDAKGGAIQLGKALNDPIAGVGALSKVGVTFTEVQKEQIKAMVEAGDVAGAQKVILAELAKEFGGSASAQAQTLAGKLENLKKNLADTAEGMVSSLLPAAEELFDGVIAPAIPVVLALMDAFGGIAGDLASGGLGLAFDSLRESIFGIGPMLGFSSEQVKGFIGALEVAYPIVKNLYNALVSLASGEVGDAGYEIFEVFNALFGKDAGLKAESVFESIVLSAMGFVDFVAANIPLVQATFSSVFGDIWRIVGSVATLFSDSILPLISQIAGDTSAQLPTAQQVFETVMAAIAGVVKFTADTLINYVIPAIAGVVAWVSANWPTINAVISTVMNTVASVIQTVLSGIQAFWSQWGDDIMAAVSFMVSNVQIIFSAFSKAFEGDWKGFGETLRVAWDNAVKAILEIGGKIGEWFAAQDWGKIGTDIVHSIAEGLTQAGQWLMDTVMAIVKAAYEAAMGFLTGGARANANVNGTQAGTQLVGADNYYNANSAGPGSTPKPGTGGNVTTNNYNVVINTQVRPDVNGELGLVTASAWQ